MKLLRWEFSPVGAIEPTRDASGAVRADFASERFANDRDLKPHKHGLGPFCRFSIRDAPKYSGVYAILVAGELVYVGECADLAQRFNTGYGIISPRNCFEGGQSTNCRVNHGVYAAASAGQTVDLFFHSTDDRFPVEEAILTILRPTWNRQLSGRVRRGEMRPPRPTPRPRSTNGSCRDQVLAAAHRVTSDRGVNTFTVDEIVKSMQSAGTEYKESTIRTHVTSICCVDAPLPHGSRYCDFERIERGMYRLIETRPHIRESRSTPEDRA